MEASIIFGPVPSRRLGRSLGFNNIPPKICSYSCVYCHLGRTLKMSLERQSFYESEVILDKVKKKLAELTLEGEAVDYLTFVPDGEPTLDLNLGRTISLLKETGLPVAVITNSSLIWSEEVREDLSRADLVSLKIDAWSEELWRKINRPLQKLNLELITKGILQFARKVSGKLITETMLLSNFDYDDEFLEIASFLKRIPNLYRVYLSTPTRPPAENWVRAAEEKIINQAYQVFASLLGPEKVECLIGYEGNAFSATGEIEEDLLSIMSVHPMRQEAVAELLKKANSSWQLMEKLLNEKKIVELEYQVNKYYLRKLNR